MVIVLVALTNCVVPDICRLYEPLSAVDGMRLLVALYVIHDELLITALKESVLIAGGVTTGGAPLDFFLHAVPKKTNNDNRITTYFIFISIRSVTQKR